VTGLFRNRAFAVTVAAILVLVSVVTGAARSMGKMRVSAESVFYNGAEGDGISAEGDLRARIDAAYNMTVIAEKYISGDESIETVLSAREALIQAQSIPEKYNANLSLTMACRDLYEKMKDAPMGERDAGYRESLNASLASRNNTFEHEIGSYNAKALEFNRVLNTFPAITARAAGAVKPLDAVK